MNSSRLKLIFIVLAIGAVMTVVTMYIYGAWQHNRYWDGTIGRVNEIESSVYQNLLTADLNNIYSKRDFDKLRGIFEPLEGKLLIRLIDNSGNIVFENVKGNRELGETIQQSQIKSDSEDFTIQIIRYLPPSWNTEYWGWFFNSSEWFSLKYDRITMPSIFYFCIWSLIVTTGVFFLKARLESDRYFHVLEEFKADNEDKLG